MVGRTLALTLLTACGKHDDKPAPAPSVPQGSAEARSDDSGPTCEQLPFADTTPVPEASGAAWLTIDGKLTLVVNSDSGHDGAFGLVDPGDGKTTAQGKLPLGSGASDDIEGLAARGRRLYGLTSSGYIREWEWQSGAFALVAGPYPIGGPDLVCKNASKTNCGNNYEGLAIAPAAVGQCDGYACSKQTGDLYCLAVQQGQLVATGAAPISVTDKTGILADCAFSPEGKLYVGHNLFGLAETMRVDGLDTGTPRVHSFGPLGTGFPETVAARGDIIYRMSDLGGDAPSLMFKFRCPDGDR